MPAGDTSLTGRGFSAASGAGWIFSAEQSGVISFRLGRDFGAGDAIAVQSATSPKNAGRGKWNNAVVTYDGSGKASGLRLYLNGRRVPISPLLNSLSSSVSYSNEYLLLGGGATFERAIALFNRELSAQQVASIYRLGTQPYRRPAMRPVNSGSINKTMTAYMAGHAAINKTATLFIAGANSLSNNLTLVMTGANNATAISGNSPLYIAGANPAVPISGNSPLYIYGASANSSGVPLSIWGSQKVASGVPLFITGTYAQSKGMNLTLWNDPFQYPANIPLVITGSSASGVNKGLDLSLYSGPDGNQAKKGMNLFISGPLGAAEKRGMNLYIAGKALDTWGAVPMVIWNSQSGVNNSKPLFISGAGTTAGAMPKSSSLNLFLRRGRSESLPLYLCGPGVPIGAGIPLTLLGGGVSASGLPLSMPKVVGGPTQTLPLYTHGF